MIPNNTIFDTERTKEKNKFYYLLSSEPEPKEK